VKVNRKQLYDKLQNLSHGLSTQNVIEQSECFVFSNGTIFTFNDEIFCSCESIGIEIEGACKSSLLLNLLGKMSEEEIDIEVVENALVVKGNKKKAKIVLEQDIALKIQEISKPTKWKKLPKEFVDMVQLASNCVSRDESKYVLTCVHLSQSYIEAGNDYQLIRCYGDVGMEDVLISGSSLSKICLVQPVEYSLTKDWMHFRTEGAIQISCRMSRETYPNIDQFLKVGGKKLKVPTELIEAVERTSLFASDQQKDDDIIQVTVAENSMKLLGTNSGGNYAEMLSIKYEGNPVKFLVKPHLLKDMLKKSQRWVLSDKLQIKTKEFVFCTSISQE